MTASRWDEYLVAEHEMIERAMEVMKAELDTLKKGNRAPFQLGRATDFLLQFGDRMHNTKEEKFLFPLMAERGIPVEGGPIAVMLKEHEAERNLLSSMLQKMPGLARLTENELSGFVQEGRDYLKVRAEHIWKENDVLYAMGRKVLTEDDNTELLYQFEQLNTATYGPEAQRHFAAMLEEVERGKEARKGMVHNLTYDQIEAIMETLPVEVTFVDAEDTVAYFNRLDKDKVFVRTRSVIGRKVDRCHPAKSVDKVLAIVDGFKNGTLDKAEFWIDFKDDKVLIRYFPVRNDGGEYMGVLEVTQEIGWIQKLTGQKVLLDQQ